MTELKQTQEQKEESIRYQVYECSNPGCGALDRMKLYPTEGAPPCINCWQCKAGFQMPVQAMQQRRVGMFPSNAPWVDQQQPGRALDDSELVDHMKTHGSQPS